MGDRDRSTKSVISRRALAISPDGAWLASAGDDGSVRVWDPAGPPRAVLASHAGPVRALAISPDGAWLASAGDDGSVRVWDPAGPPRAVLASHAGPVRALAISPDGAWLASAGDDGSVRVWDPAGPPRAVLASHAGPVRALAISPDGAWLASAGDDGSVRVWDPAGPPRAVLASHAGPVRALAISPDGAWLASAGDDGSVRVWDPAGPPRAVLASHAGPVRALAISPDGAWLASAGDDGSVRVWDPAGPPRAVLASHAGPVRALAISPDGAWLASAGDDGSVRVWDPAGPPRAVLASHAGPVRALAISPDGAWLASAGDDGSVRIWDPATETSLYLTTPIAFLSYAREDLPIADRLRQLLTTVGITVWSDEQIPVGSSIAGQIESAIRASDVIFFVSSPKSNNSPAVNAELALAVIERNRNPRKVIIPVFAGSGDNVPPLLRDIAGLDIKSDEHARDQLARLWRQLHVGGDSPPQRTPQDLDAQLELLTAEFHVLEVQEKSYYARARTRELDLRTLLAFGIGLAIFASLGILASLLAIGNHSTPAWIATTANLCLAVVSFTAIRQSRAVFHSALSRRSRDDDS